jgi:flagellum-specific ATP synthase
MKQTRIINCISMAAAALERFSALSIQGEVSSLSGLAMEISGLANHIAVGDQITVACRQGSKVPAEIIGFSDGLAQAMPFASLEGLGPGCSAQTSLTAAQLTRSGAANGQRGTLAVHDLWLGRVIDPLGRPLDRKGPLPTGAVWRAPRGPVVEATLRARLGPRLDMGVRAINCFVSCREGQRLGLFAGSGVGKSTLLAMMAKQSKADVIVLALVGERGREVREFLEDDLGPDGLARTVVVVATSDAPPLLRR